MGKAVRCSCQQQLYIWPSSTAQWECTNRFGYLCRSPKTNESSMVRTQASDAFIRIGLPMFILVTGGSLLLSQLLQGKYDIKVLCVCSL